MGLTRPRGLSVGAGHLAGDAGALVVRGRPAWRDAAASVASLAESRDSVMSRSQCTAAWAIFGAGYVGAIVFVAWWRAAPGASQPR